MVHLGACFASDIRPPHLQEGPLFSGLVLSFILVAEYPPFVRNANFLRCCVGTLDKPLEAPQTIARVRLPEYLGRGCALLCSIVWRAPQLHPPSPPPRILTTVILLLYMVSVDHPYVVPPTFIFPQRSVFRLPVLNVVHSLMRLGVSLRVQVLQQRSRTCKAVVPCVRSSRVGGAPVAVSAAAHGVRSMLAALFITISKFNMTNRQQ